MLHLYEVDVRNVEVYDTIMIEALYLGPKYVEALEIQRKRQTQA